MSTADLIEFCKGALNDPEGYLQDQLERLVEDVLYAEQDNQRLVDALKAQGWNFVTLGA
jgi:hypothetical protein